MFALLFRNMATQLTLQRIPNQQFSFTAENSFYLITLKSTDAECFLTIQRNGVTILETWRCVCNVPVIQFNNLSSGFGNLMFYSQKYDYPNFQNFGIDTYLLYLTIPESQQLGSIYEHDVLGP